QRTRLLYVGNDGRLFLWHVALEAYREDPVHGTGADTYALMWDRKRNSGGAKSYAHSLYLGMLGDLGLVGLVLLATALVALGLGLARRARGSHRGIYAAALGVTAAWAVHAGLDWDWETPAVTVVVFALAGLG